MKSTRFALGKALWRTLAVLCAVLFVSFGFVACKPETETEYVYPQSVYALQGTWSATYANGYVESYTIDLETNTFDAGAYSYAGNNMVVRFTGTDAGYIYIKYTRSADESWNYTETAPDVGKWYAIAFKNLKESSISLSGAYLATGATSKDTLSEAIAEFTIEKGYFATYSELAKN